MLWNAAFFDNWITDIDDHQYFTTSRLFIARHIASNTWHIFSVEGPVESLYDLPSKEEAIFMMTLIATQIKKNVR